jgi:penicillin-binding protein 1A
MPIAKQFSISEAIASGVVRPCPKLEVAEHRGRRGFRAFMARFLQTGRLRLAVGLVAVPMGLLLLLSAGLIHHVYFDRSDLPDLEAFLRFELPGVGAIHDSRGEILIELAREYRRSVSFGEIPVILRDAILAAEDKNFFTHSGVEYAALPRIVQKSASHSLAAWWRGDGLRPIFPQGGSTLTQQLVRSYFLSDLTSRENSDALIAAGLAPRLLSVGLGVKATNKLVRKMEEVRLSLWLEEEMRRRYGSPERAKREIFTRYANFIYLGNGRYGFAAASEYYFGKPLPSYTADDAGRASLLAGIGKSPGTYAPAPGDARPTRRRNEILTLMARNGYISEELAKRCATEPIQVAGRNPVKTEAPGAVSGVLEELKRIGLGRFGVEDLLQGRIVVRSTVDGRVQDLVNEALERGLGLYEERHRKSDDVIQGSVVVLRNADAAILAEVGGRRQVGERATRYSDLNRVTGSLRQAGSAWKAMVYLAAFGQGIGLDTSVPDEPISVPTDTRGEEQWIANYDMVYKGPIPARQALAESRNAAAVWVAREIGMDKVNQTARDMGIRSPLPLYISTALGASGVRLLELADAYRTMASGIRAIPHFITRVTDAHSASILFEAPTDATVIGADGPTSEELSLIQEGLRGVIRLPEGTAHVLDGPDFPIQVMGKTGTSNDFRDALFVGSTYGRDGITVAVRIGFDDNRSLGPKETGSRAALPIFREIMLRVYGGGLVGPSPHFPAEIEMRIDTYLASRATDGEECIEPIAAFGDRECRDRSAEVRPARLDRDRGIERASHSWGSTETPSSPVPRSCSSTVSLANEVHDELDL